jgi:hypothetical protein
MRLNRVRLSVAALLALKSTQILVRYFDCLYLGKKHR